ncbi:D-alanyl-D-alanine carboxypeptidase family protein, partial [Rhodosalinus sp.]|uniref:D-alanyl-D-alanine carboxypeptidase family protein n=1 Tax=Rhodosalinus sp. TaxID=2047741 RepID=UPI00397B7486
MPAAHRRPEADEAETVDRGQPSGPVRAGLWFVTILWFAVALPPGAAAAPYAAMVMDARSGEILHSENADSRLHPASLTKMMTLYVVFEAVQNGEIGLDDLVTISRAAAAEPPSKLGLRPGQQIKLRYLIRAAAVRSANDAATALAEAISGSEAAFARRMNRTAKAMGMTRTTFRNAHGLTEDGHLSTARDMTILGRHLFYDYPQYYNLFSRRSTHAGVKTVPNTNRRLLDAYAGADGIKTGYTRAAGFNLVASAERGSERVIATVFGGHSTAWRNQRVAELMDLGFRKAPTQVAERRPARPAYVGNVEGPAGKTVRVSGLVTRSLRPQIRPGAALPAGTLAVAEAVAESVETPVIAEGSSPAGSTAPAVRPEAIAEVDAPEPEVITRVSTSEGRHWAVNIGRYPSRYDAEKVLLTTALTDISALDGALRKVVPRSGGFDAQFVGLTRDGADRACHRLKARNITCFMV